MQKIFFLYGMFFWGRDCGALMGRKVIFFFIPPLFGRGCRKIKSPDSLSVLMFAGPPPSLPVPAFILVSEEEEGFFGSPYFRLLEERRKPWC